MKLVSKNNKNDKRDNGSDRNTAIHRDNPESQRVVQNRGNMERRNNVSDHNNTEYRRNPNGYSNSGYDRNSYEQPPLRKKSHIKTIVIIVLIIAFGFAALFLSLGFYVRSLDTIFPNVWVDGIKVSGLTISEATQVLIFEGYETNAEGIVATIVFPDDSRFSVTGGEVGLSFNAAEAAAGAFTFGRDDTFFNNEIIYLRALFNRTDLYDLSNPVFDDSIIHELAAEYTERFNETLFDSSIEHNNGRITIIKGTGIYPAIDTEVFNLTVHTLMRAVVEHEHLTAAYSPETNVADSVDSQILELRMLFEYIHIEPISSQLIFEEDNLIVTESTPGQTFDLDAAIEELRAAEYGDAIVSDIYAIEPEYSQEEIEAMLFRDVLAESTTRIAGTSSRLANIALAAKNIDGTVLNPGDVFSFNQVVGPRRRDTGFLEANVMIGGRLVLGIGGGICQASSTIYDAILRTHLEVIERHPHGLTVAYLPFGNDATVAYGNLDFKFRNNTDFPIRVESAVNGRDITVKLIGTKLDDNYIEIETVSISTTPYSIVQQESEDLLIGQTEVWTPGQTGHTVETFQLLFTADGELISRTSVGRSRYNVQNRVILHGTAEPPPEHYEPSYEEQPGEHYESGPPESGSTDGDE